jgi:hypothetical protein
MLDVAKILEELRQEKEHLEQAINTLERLAQGRTNPRRGRPPAWMSEVTSAPAPKKRGRPPGSKNKATSATAAGEPKDTAVA